MKYLKNYSSHINENSNEPIVTGLSVGQKVEFKPGTYKVISNYEIDISGKTGEVVEVRNELYPHAIVVIKLDERMEDLDSWNNELIFSEVEELERLSSSIEVLN